MRKLTRFIPVITLCGLLVIIFVPISAQAFSYWDVTDTLGLANADLEITVIEIIKWILGLVSLIALIMVLYGGISWLTSAGNEEKISKAKKVLTAAIIGLVVIMLSWAILNYAALVIISRTK